MENLCKIIKNYDHRKLKVVPRLTRRGSVGRLCMMRRERWTFTSELGEMRLCVLECRTVDRDVHCAWTVIGFGKFSVCIQHSVSQFRKFAVGNCDRCSSMIIQSTEIMLSKFVYSFMYFVTVCLFGVWSVSRWRVTSPMSNERASLLARQISENVHNKTWHRYNTNSQCSLAHICLCVNSHCRRPPKDWDIFKWMATLEAAAAALLEHRTRVLKKLFTG